MRKTPFYDDPEYDYKAYWHKRKYEDLADRLALKKLLGLVTCRDRLVDIGAGFGRLSPVYLPIFKKVILVDPSQKMLDKAKTKIASKRVKYVKSFAEKMPFDKDSFQIALIIRTCHHLENPPQALAETSRILDPNGYLIIEFANKLHFKARVKAILQLNFNYFTDLKPLKIGKNKKKSIPFCNYHPKYVERRLKKAGFKIIKRLSVSNFRSPIFKKLLPLKMLMILENLLQEAYAPFNLGPSIFFLCQKNT